MAIRTFRCGSSSTVYNAPPVRHARAVPTIPFNRPDREPPRLRTRLHLAGVGTAVHGFRVIARFPDGVALVGMGATRQEVAARARTHSAVVFRQGGTLHLQQWVGGLCFGRWLTLPARRGELGALPRHTVRRRRDSPLV